MGDREAAQASAATGVETGTACGALEPVSHCHTILGILARDREEWDAAAEHFERSGAIAEELGNEDDVLTANENLADLALVAGRLDEARRRWESVIEQHRRQGLSDEAGCQPYLGLGQVAYYEARLDDAERLLGRSFELASAAKFPHIGALALYGLAAVAAARGLADEAAVLLGRGAALMSPTGGEPMGSEAVIFERARTAALEALGEERFAELHEEGRTRLSERTFPSDTPG